MDLFRQLAVLDLLELPWPLLLQGNPQKYQKEDGVPWETGLAMSLMV
jgi:hypothetical protein